MTNVPKIAYVIGRFQPFHRGHEALVAKALEIADLAVVIIGDTGCRPDYRNPWTVEEREEMIRVTFEGKGADRLRFVSVEDIPYDDTEWKFKVREAICLFNTHQAKRFLVGHKKDASSFYLDMFPEWEFVSIDAVTQKYGGGVLDATEMRDMFFGKSFIMDVPEPVNRWCHNWKKGHGDRWLQVFREREAVVKHNAEWNCPAVRKYGGPVIAAVDVLLHDHDHVLLIRRRGGVGEGALAMPGGFVEPHERLVDAALRELHEETGIKIYRDDLPGNGIGLMTPFDHPGRSMRGRIITNVLCLKVPHQELTPAPGDDAGEAMWVEKATLPSLKREFFSDHFHIINYFTEKK